MDKNVLFGWACLLESTFNQFGLEVVESLLKICFGPCRHMDVIGWPSNEGDRTNVSQKLGLEAAKAPNLHLLTPQLPIPKTPSEDS